MRLSWESSPLSNLNGPSTTLLKKHPFLPNLEASMLLGDTHPEKRDVLPANYAKLHVPLKLSPSKLLPDLITPEELFDTILI